MPPTPWTPLDRPLAACRVALVTSCGVHLKTDPPFDLAGDPGFRTLPVTLTADQVTFTHSGYDPRMAVRDFNVVFPLTRLQELAAEGLVGAVAPRHFSFMGAHMDTAALTRDTAPEVARRLSADAVDVVLLTPC